LYPGLRKLAKKVKVRPLSDTQKSLHERSRPGIVKVKLRSGVQLEASVEDPKWSPRDPPSDADVSKKFRLLVGDLLSEEQREELHDMVMDLENVADVSEIAELTIP
jgi:2-methylcitrate dehydratase PrpD